MWMVEGKWMWSQLKILQHKDILFSIINKTLSKPVHVQFELTESCNYGCIFCPWHGENKTSYDNLDFTGKRFFPTQRLLRLIDELEDIGTKAISITGTGENLIHPDFDIIAKKLSQTKIDFALTTNFGVKLKEGVIRDLLKAKWLRWSVNAADKETYNKTNRPKIKNAFDIAKTNIENLVRLRRDEKVHIGASFVIGNYNKHNILDIVEFTKSLKIDSISFRPDTPLLRTQKRYEYDKDIVDTLKYVKKSYETDDFKIYINLQRLEDSLVVDDENLKCYYSNFSIHIISNGDVYPCCMTRYDRRYSFGNIMNCGFKDFWESQDRVDNYKKIYIKNCPSCHHTKTNVVLKNFYDIENIDNFI